MSASVSSSVISRDNQDTEEELDREYGVIQEVESEVGAAHLPKFKIIKIPARTFLLLAH
jgi:hypothetical protein